MGYQIKHLTQDEKEAFIREHPLAEPREWALMDGKFIEGFYDTEAEATTELKRLQTIDAITDRWEDWVYKTAEELNIPEAAVQKAIRNYI